MGSMMEELQATRAIEAYKGWDFLGQAEIVRAPLSFSPVRSGEPVEEVSHVLPVLDSMGAKMLMLEEIVLVEKVAEHVLTCF
jgi:hypothetical protein